MGYRSDVVIKCQERAFDMFVAAMRQHNFKPDYVGKMPCSDEYVFQWMGVKWYDEYYEIYAVDDVMRQLDGLEFTEGFGYSFVRLGENYEDIETRENTYDIDLYVLRTIDGADGSRELSFDDIIVENGDCRTENCCQETNEIDDDLFDFDVDMFIL